MTMYTGGCHCGDLAIEYKTALQPGNWPLRECQCSFAESTPCSVRRTLMAKHSSWRAILLLCGDIASLPG